MRGEKRSTLTPRELEVIDLLIEGHSNASVAAQLDVEFETVKSHVSHIMDKLRCRSRLDIAVTVLRARHAAEIKALRRKYCVIEYQSH